MKLCGAVVILNVDQLRTDRISDSDQKSVESVLRNSKIVFLEGSDIAPDGFFHVADGFFLSLSLTDAAG